MLDGWSYQGIADFCAYEGTTMDGPFPWSKLPGWAVNYQQKIDVSSPAGYPMIWDNVYWHNGGWNMNFMDGHAKWFRQGQEPFYSVLATN
jgi:prepilin-type processing-associated H-X9-DG protein